MTTENSNKKHTESTSMPVIFEKLHHPKIWMFAIITIAALILSLGSLTEVSSRQSSLAEADANMQVLQERITASIFLSLDAKGFTPAKNEQEIIDPETIAHTYLELTNSISVIKNKISNGSDHRNEAFNSDMEYLIAVYSLPSLSTDTLLGLLLISCGVLGSVMSTMRDGKGSAAKAVVLGASVGFVALLGVKSGSTLFILTNAGIDVPYNPYSTAFAGVVAGMFSEKLYTALSKLTDKALGDESANK